MEVRRGEGAGLVDVEDGAADGAREPRRIEAGEGACGVAGLLGRRLSRLRGREEQFRVALVVEAVQPRQDEVGRADHGADGAHRRSTHSCGA